MNNTDLTPNKYQEVIFYTISDLVLMLGWSLASVQKLFNDPRFPAVDYGKNKVVEKHALIDYFSVRREKKYDSYWRD
ncbi:MAG: hypothetical protein IK104_08520 [Clostridia bacterium]|nr:hypothetical protein [Clostridia bacterium]